MAEADVEIIETPKGAISGVLELYDAEKLGEVFARAEKNQSIHEIARETDVLETHVRWILAVGKEAAEHALGRPVANHKIVAEIDPLGDKDEAKRSLARRYFLEAHELLRQSAEVVPGDEKWMYEKRGLLHASALATDKFLDLIDGRRGTGAEIAARHAMSASQQNIFIYKDNISLEEEEDGKSLIEGRVTEVPAEEEER